jgi:hypothetical protein
LTDAEPQVGSITCLVCGAPDGGHADDCATRDYPTTYTPPTDEQMADGIAQHEAEAAAAAVPPDAPTDQVVDADPGDENDAADPGDAVTIDAELAGKIAAAADAVTTNTPRDVELPFDHTDRAALEAIERQNRRVATAKSEWEGLKEETSTAKKAYDREVETLANLINQLTAERRDRERQPTLPGIVAPKAADGCAWERANPGKPCPVCRQRPAGADAPPRDLADHPDHPDHARVAGDLDANPYVPPVGPTTAPTPDDASVLERLIAAGVYVSADDVDTLPADELDGLLAHLAAPGPVPPAALVRSHIAADVQTADDYRYQLCRHCTCVLRDSTDQAATWYPAGAFVGLNVCPTDQAPGVAAQPQGGAQ